MEPTTRCSWAQTPLSIAYHDGEWGLPVHETRPSSSSSRSKAPTAFGISPRWEGPNQSGPSLGPSCELPRLGVDFHLFPFFDEEGHPEFETGLERGQLGDAATGRIATDARLAGGDLQFHVGRKLQSDGVAVELLNLNDQVVHQQVAVLAHDIRSEREGLERLLVHEVVARAVGVQI